MQGKSQTERDKNPVNGAAEIERAAETAKAAAAEQARIEAARIEAAPRSLAIAKQGVTTGRQFANLMSALMSDLIEGKVTPGVGNAACNAGGKLLKVVELQAKYGRAGDGSPEKSLVLTGPEIAIHGAEATA